MAQTIRYGSSELKRDAFSCLALVIGRKGQVPLVRELSHQFPLWKLPGGRNKPGETPIQTVIREVGEELGLTVDESQINELGTLDRSDHQQHVFLVDVDTFAGLHEFGQENGNPELEVKLFDQVTFLHEDLLYAHRRVLQDFRHRLRELGVDL